MRDPWFAPAVEGLNAGPTRRGMQILIGGFRLDGRTGGSLVPSR